MFNVFLDDERETPEGYVRVCTVQECIRVLSEHKGLVRILSLDNDLGIPGIREEGREVCNWLAERWQAFGEDFWPVEEIGIHSANPVARDYMAGTILRYAPDFIARTGTAFERRGR